MTPTDLVFISQITKLKLKTIKAFSGEQITFYKRERENRLTLTEYALSHIAGFSLKLDYSGHQYVKYYS